MWNGNCLEAQACFDNFKQVGESFVFFSIPTPTPHPLHPTPILVFVGIYREICAFFLFDCTQWEVVWDLFARGDKQTKTQWQTKTQCPLGGLRKLEKFDVSGSLLKGTGKKRDRVRAKERR